MRIVSCLLFAFLFSSSVMAQEISQTDKNNMQDLIDICQLNDEQAQKLEALYVKKAEDVQRVKTNYATVPTKQRKKLRAIQEGTVGSIYLLIEPDQKESYKLYQIKKREEVASKVKELKEQGADQATIEDAMLGIY